MTPLDITAIVAVLMGGGLIVWSARRTFEAETGLIVFTLKLFGAGIAVSITFAIAAFFGWLLLLKALKLLDSHGLIAFQTGGHKIDVLVLFLGAPVLYLILWVATGGITSQSHLGARMPNSTVETDAKLPPI